MAARTWAESLMAFEGAVRDELFVSVFPGIELKKTLRELESAQRPIRLRDLNYLALTSIYSPTLLGSCFHYFHFLDHSDSAVSATYMSLALGYFSVWMNGFVNMYIALHIETGTCICFFSLRTGDLESNFSNRIKSP